MLEQTTPVLLTFNEDQNIRRTLSCLGWAKDIVVVDSGSTDGTLAILAEFPNVRVFKRGFDTHAKQWRYAVEETQIVSEWILRLDADYQVSDALVAELARLNPNAAVNAYRIAFDYAIFSHKLRIIALPPQHNSPTQGLFLGLGQGPYGSLDRDRPGCGPQRPRHARRLEADQTMADRPGALHAT